MENTHSFPLLIEALAELAEQELSQRTKVLPALSSLLADSAALPHTALFLGLAEDGLPVLLDLSDPTPGPILVIADQAGGKTALLQMVARAAELAHPASEVQSGIVTPYPAEWQKFQTSPGTVGIYATQEGGARDLLQSLVTWAHNNKGEGQSILLLIDDLEAVIQMDSQAEQNLRWLLLRGPSRRVWPIITMNASRLHNLEAWLGFFRTRLFGLIQDPHDSQWVSNDMEQTFASLTPSQFSMREGNIWVKFWAPEID